MELRFYSMEYQATGKIAQPSKLEIQLTIGEDDTYLLDRNQGQMDSYPDHSPSLLRIL